MASRRGRPRPPAALLCLPPLCLACLCLLGLQLAVQQPVPPQLQPQPAGYSRLYPHNVTLPGLGRLRYVVNADPCGGAAPVTLLLLVTSHQGDGELRSAWRRLLPPAELSRLSARRVFLLARPSVQAGYTSVSQPAVERESARHADIVQGDFAESYRNLTIKHLMGLRWAADFCPQARYVVKMDDDIAVDVYQLHDRLTERYPDSGLLLGLIHYDMRPIRQPDSKWYVSESEYPGEFYRPFLSGWMYVVTVDVIRRLLAAAETRRNFWIDDVHVTGTLAAAAGVRLRALNTYYTPHREHLECCARAAGLVCDYLAGPSGGDGRLLADFVRQTAGCWRSGCARRPPESAVSRTCVGTDRYRQRPPVAGTAEVVPITYGAR